MKAKYVTISSSAKPWYAAAPIALLFGGAFACASVGSYPYAESPPPESEPTPAPSNACTDDATCTTRFAASLAPTGCGTFRCVDGVCVGGGRDSDGDGHPAKGCAASVDVAFVAGDDCDDSDKAAFPGAPFSCTSDGDKNCDGVADRTSAACTCDGASIGSSAPCMSGGARACTAAAGGAAWGACTAVPEGCNPLRDDDLDGIAANAAACRVPNATNASTGGAAGTKCGGTLPAAGIGNTAVSACVQSAGGALSYTYLVGGGPCPVGDGSIRTEPAGFSLYCGAAPPLGWVAAHGASAWDAGRYFTVASSACPFRTAVQEFPDTIVLDAQSRPCYTLR